MVKQRFEPLTDIQIIKNLIALPFEQTSQDQCCSFDPLLPFVNFSNILEAVFVLIFFYQKITNPNCRHIKDSKTLLYEKAAGKMLIK